MSDEPRRVLSVSEINEIFAAHELWVSSEYKQGVRAHLVNCSLEALRTQARPGLNLSEATFDRCDLNGLYFDSANLCHALFTKTSLAYANLAGADLTNATLLNCDLTGASLDNATLRYARLANTKLDGVSFNGANIAHIKSPDLPPIARLDFGGWSVTVYAEETVIGCKRHSNQEWLSWTVDSPEIIKMHWDAKKWWHLYGPVVKAAILAVRTRVESIQPKQQAEGEST